ncbi:MAG TPA: RNA 2',3'-cyclic phosphodiesterase [Planctomycetota bacterium]|nr:RNA 2',3'-cyclic phosphodiesterase [Planctomycetota bacterium]
MRCFVAIKPSESVRERIAALQCELRLSTADVRWIGAGELHLTLRFLGELGEETVSRLRRTFSDIGSTVPGFSLTYAGIGEFPRVVWVGGSADARPLAARIESAAEREGLARDPHGFNPHLTIGRIRSDRGSKALAAAVLLRKELRIGVDPVTEFSLFKSTLTPQGPVYETIETFTLAQA